MINNRVKNERGITLVSLAIGIAVLIILANVIVYNIKDYLKVANLEKMQNDIENLSDKISAYYAQNGKIPANQAYEYTNIQPIKNAGVISEKVDTGKFLVIDLSAIENLTLNNGRDFEKIKTLENPTVDQLNQYTDLYIINETSHNIFYVAGINIDDQIFYTNYTAEDTDPTSVDLRYIEGVKIPDGFSYQSGTKEIGIIIESNSDKTKRYKWIPVNEKITEVPPEVKVNIQKTEEFIKSVNAYGGYYEPTNNTNTEIMYLELENWSPIYDEEGIYQDKNGDTAYIPKGFQVSKTPGENTIDEGLVVKDSNHNNNEWVWIEVPKSIYITAKSSTDYANLEKDMQTYASIYRSDNYKDIWYSEEQHGFKNEDDYNNWKNTMLKSVYENGGFYIGRYEVGTQIARFAKTDKLTEPIIQKNAYPYNWVTCRQAQEEVRKIQVEGKTTSLMFGIQWDLILKFIQEKEAKTEEELKTDSTTWGNYSNATFTITRGSYTRDPSLSDSWKKVELDYKKPSSGVLLATGVTDRNSVLNIYDLAGNVLEWTLEYSGDPEKQCGRRGGFYEENGDNDSAYIHESDVIDSSQYYNGFRSCLW